MLPYKTLKPGGAPVFLVQPAITNSRGRDWSRGIPCFPDRFGNPGVTVPGSANNILILMDFVEAEIYFFISPVKGSSEADLGL